MRATSGKMASKQIMGAKEIRRPPLSKDMGTSRPPAAMGAMAGTTARRKGSHSRSGTYSPKGTRWCFT